MLCLAQAIGYRDVKGFNHIEVALSIGVQRMVCSDLSGFGVLFSTDRLLEIMAENGTRLCRA